MKKLLFLFIVLSFNAYAQIPNLENFCSSNVFDLTDMDTFVASNQNIGQLLISYHHSQADAASNSNRIENVATYTATTTDETIFARAYNTATTNLSIDVFHLIVHTALDVRISATLNFPSSNFMAFTSGGQEPYVYAWEYNGVVIPSETTENIYILNRPSGAYTVTVTDSNGCTGFNSMNSLIPQTITANDDQITFTGLDNGTPNQHNVLDNDILNGWPAASTAVTISLVSSSNTDIGITPQGSIAFNPETLNGQYTVVYQICEIANPNNCDTATVHLLIDYCRTATPIVDSIEQPTCSGSTGGIVHLSGLPSAGTSYITYVVNHFETTISESGETFALGGLIPGDYSLTVYAQDILMGGCIQSLPVTFTIEQNYGITLNMQDTYVDFNANGMTDIGDVIDYQYTITNHSCEAVTSVTMDSYDFIINGNPIPAIAQGSTDNSNFSSRYILTQEDINNSSVFKRAEAYGNYGSNIFVSRDSITTNLNIPNGIKLNAFFDTNHNGVQDNSEQNFTGGHFGYQVNAGVFHDVSSSDGIYYLYENNPNNTYTVSYILNPSQGCQLNYTLSTASYSNIIVAAGPGIITYNFPITVANACADLSVLLSNYSAPPRPGFIYHNYLMYKNNSNQVVGSGTVTFVKDNLLTITSISQLGTTATPNGFTYDFTNLQPFETRYIDISMQVPTIPIIALGNFLTNSASISIPVNDINIENNTDSLSQVIVGSYDPNDKAENHGGKIVFSQFTANDYLTYTIRFENTGTAEAVNIRVEDELDEQLDETSVTMLRASHAYVLDRVGHTLNWKFEGVNLPPSVENDEVTGHGYVIFQVKPKPGFALGDVIPNHANIFFDFNPAIVTDTCVTEFVNALATENFAFEQFKTYPNPTNGLLHIANNTKIDNVLVTSVLGQIVVAKSINALEAEIDLSSLSKGIYFVKATAQNQQKTVKIVKE